MEMPPLVKKKSTKKKVDDELTQWQHRLGRDVRYNTRLLEVMKPFVDTFMVSQGQEAFNGPTDRAIHLRAMQMEMRSKKKKAGEEEDDKTIEDVAFEPYHDDFENVFVPAHPSIGSPIIYDPSDQPEVSYKKSIMKGKSKGVAGSSEGPKDDQH